MQEVTENAKDLYGIRQEVINTFEGKEKTEDNISVDLRWLKYPDYFERLKNEYNENPELKQTFDKSKNIFNFKKIGKLINDISTSKINNVFDAEAEYLQKIKKDKYYLRSIKLKSDDSIKLRKFFNDTEYTVFGTFFPSEQTKKIDISEEELETQYTPPRCIKKTDEENEKIKQRQEEAEKKHMQ